MQNSPDMHVFTVMGQEYKIRSKASKKAIDRAVDLLNQRIDQIKGSSSQSQIRLAVMTALNLADDLLLEQDKNQQQIAELETKVTAIRDYVSEVIQQSKEE